jgi:hypothetical protein
MMKKKIFVFEIIGKVERQWISEYFEYGLCTRITSNDIVQSSNRDLLCPSHLKCLANGDKYVCSCGLNKFFEQRSNGFICGKMFIPRKSIINFLRY